MDKSQEVVNLATELVQYCEKKGAEFNDCQAALGEAWIRTLKIFGHTRQSFLELATELSLFFSEDITQEHK